MAQKRSIEEAFGIGPEKPNIPRVVRLQRRNGQVVQGCDLYVGRKCDRGGWLLPQSKWANPFSVSQCGGSVEAAVKRYKEYIETRPDLLDDIHELTAKTLGCWCKPGPCHADVLVSLWHQQYGQEMRFELVFLSAPIEVDIFEQRAESILKQLHTLGVEVDRVTGMEDDDGCWVLLYKVTKGVRKFDDALARIRFDEDVKVRILPKH